MSIEQDPFGRKYRSGRLSDEQTAKRMLEVATDQVYREHEGLPVSFDSLKFEDIIADAGVARSAVYRRWPTKNHFYADLLRELSGHNRPAIGAFDENTVQLTIRLIRENFDEFREPESRHAWVVELCRQGALQNYSAIAGSVEWNVYITITATLSTLPTQSPLREDLQHGLLESEKNFYTKMGYFYQNLMDLFGYRLIADLADITPEVVAQLGAAIVEGLAVNTIADPNVANLRFKADPFSTGRMEQWSLPGLGFTSVVLSFVEPDPQSPTHWNDEETVRRQEKFEELAAFVSEMS